MRYVLIAMFLVLLVSTGTFVALFMERYIWVYRIQDRMLKIKIFGVFTLHRIWWTEIEDLKIVPAWEPRWAYIVGGYEFSGKRVLVKLRKGLMRNVLLTPKDPGKFVEEILERVKQAQAKS